MSWFKEPTETVVKVSIVVACPLGRVCDSFDHTFTAEATAQLPLLIEEERSIRAKLQAQLEPMVAKFMEQHKP